MKTNNRIENLLRGITTRIDIITHSFNQGLELKKTPIHISIIKWVMSTGATLLFTFLIINPVSHRTEKYFEYTDSPVSTKIINCSNKIPQGDLQFSNSNDLTQPWHYKINLSGEIVTHQGTLQSLYLIYTDSDIKNYSINDFHRLSFHTSNATLKSYLRNIFTTDNTKNYNFNSSIIYKSKNRPSTKNAYLLAIDQLGNFHYELLKIQISESIIAKDGTELAFYSTTEKTELFPPLKNKIFKVSKFSGEDFIKDDNPNASIDLSLAKQYQYDTEQLTKIIRPFLN